MGLSGKGYVVLPDSITGKRVRASESWHEILRRWMVECPQCSEVWLVVGAREGESYVCRDCGNNFAIKLQVSDKGAGYVLTGEGSRERPSIFVNVGGKQYVLSESDID